MDPSRKKSVLRAMPHRSPDEIAAENERRHDDLQVRLDEIAAQAGRLRRCSLALGAGLAGVLVLATVLTVYLLDRIPATPAAHELDGAKGGPGNLAQGNPKSSAGPGNSTTPGGAAAAQPAAKESAGAGTTKPAGATEAHDPARQDLTLEVLGGLSAINLYQSYLAIGMLADGVEGKAFTVEGANTTLAIVTNCLTLMDGKLAKLDKADLDSTDRDSLNRIKAVTAMLRLQAQALQAYWTSGKMEHGEAYRQARKTSWTALSKVLGLDVN